MRYWDCCKLHCSWTSNVFTGNPAPSCSQSNVSQGVDDSITSACNGGDGYACWNLAPWAVGNKLSYGYAAVPVTGDICGKCYQLYFTGGRVIGKTMIVQAVNIGYDVAGGLFDIQIPGGGVGAFDACSKQWGVASSSLGANYGGFLSTCKSTYGTGASTSVLQSCVMDKCNSIFGATGREDLLAGCKWFVDWFEVSDVPTLIYKEIACPAAITANSGMYR
ncbi:MAG: hypothetical protein JXR91_08365 [Deltaproteobacteria bacterium]|nr:hypothetical protein [Deltaproteobacteria bacterium]